MLCRADRNGKEGHQPLTCFSLGSLAREPVVSDRTRYSKLTVRLMTKGMKFWFVCLFFCLVYCSRLRALCKCLTEKERERERKTETACARACVRACVCVCVCVYVCVCMSARVCVRARVHVFAVCVFKLLTSKYM